MIDVSVILISYNHEKYIKKALNSILMQKVNFNYEIIFADDCSTDNTQKIIRENSKNIKNKLYLFNKENKGNTYNSLNAYKNCKGKYIVALEADDYWSSEDKLQTQYDFLEKHKDYIAVSNKRYTINKNGEKLVSYPLWIKKDTDVNIKDLLHGRYFAGIETMFKNIFKENLVNDEFCELYLKDRMIGDLPMCFLLVELGKVHVFNSDMSVYRTSTSGNVQNYNHKLKLTQIAQDHILILNRLNIYNDYKYDFSTLYAEHLMESFIGSVMNKNFKSFKQSLNTIPKKSRIKSQLLMIKLVPNYLFKTINKIIHG